MNPLALALMLGLWLIGGSELRRFERDAANDLSTQLQGEAKKVEVRSKIGPEVLFGDFYGVNIEASHFRAEGLPLYTEPDRSKRGILRHLHLDLRDFFIRDLHVQHLHADIPECRFDLPLALKHRKVRLSRGGVGQGRVELSAEDLEKFIPIKFREVKTVKVNLSKDRVMIEGFGEFVLFAADFHVEARLVTTDATRLLLTDARIAIDGAPADEAAARAVLNTLNPVIDLDKDLGLHGAIRVGRLAVSAAGLLAECVVTIPTQPEVLSSSPSMRISRIARISRSQPGNARAASSRALRYASGESSTGTSQTRSISSSEISEETCRPAEKASNSLSKSGFSAWYFSSSKGSSGVKSSAPTHCRCRSSSDTPVVSSAARASASTRP